MNMSIQNTIDNLKQNNMEAFFCENESEALELVKTLIKKGDTVSHGGSETLKEVGIIDLIKNGEYKYLDRARAGITPDEVEKVYRDTYSADVFFTSSNAVTESGYLYNVDGNSNRVSAILYGPKSVIMIVGVNKLVKTIDEAVERVKKIAAPKNTVRLNLDSYCSKTGECLSIKNSYAEMCDGCHSNGRICCNYVLCGQQRHKNRIKVIIVNKSLGY